MVGGIEEKLVISKIADAIERTDEKYFILKIKR